MNLDDKSLFLDAMEDVQPLKQCRDVHWQPVRNARTRQELDTLQLDNFLTHLRHRLNLSVKGYRTVCWINFAWGNITSRPA